MGGRQKRRPQKKKLSTLRNCGEREIPPENKEGELRVGRQRNLRSPWIGGKKQYCWIFTAASDVRKKMWLQEGRGTQNGRGRATGGKSPEGEGSIFDFIPRLRPSGKKGDGSRFEPRNSIKNFGEGSSQRRQLWWEG